MVPSAERDPLLASLISDLSRRSLLGAIEVAADAFLHELRLGDPALAARLREPLMLVVHGSQQAAELTSQA